MIIFIIDLLTTGFKLPLIDHECIKSAPATISYRVFKKISVNPKAKNLKRSYFKWLEEKKYIGPSLYESHCVRGPELRKVCLGLGLGLCLG